MIRRLLPALVLLVTCSCALAQSRAASSSLPPHVFTAFGTFERVPTGWRCRYISPSAPQLLRGLQIGDVLTTIDTQGLSEASAIGMLQQLRMVEFGWAGSVEALRAGQRLKWQAPETPPQIVASQQTLTVLRSTVPGIRPGDVLTTLGQVPFRKALPQDDNPLTVVVDINLQPGHTVHVTRSAEPAETLIANPALVHLVRFDLDPSQEVPAGTVLRGLNTSSVGVQALRGQWTLLNFWATWCVPCIRHLPEMRELAQTKNLNVAAIGFADSEERLAAAGAQEKALKVFAPHAAVQQQLPMSGIPFDVLLDPQGKAALVVSGDVRDLFKAIVLQYVNQ